jgi:GT2 family glycosyltransferase
MTGDLPAVSAMLPAHQRIEQTLETLRRLKACQPPPDEILVHVASSQTEMVTALAAAHADVQVLLSEVNGGPGGARNRMLEAARNEFVASFDDDSYPDRATFFKDLALCFEQLEGASILALNIYEGAEEPPSMEGSPHETAHFVGCGCAYRRSHFLQSAGYVPIPIAYSMEEADLALRYREAGRSIWYIPALRVYHDTQLSHHASPKVAAMQVANTALFAYLRYPLRRWPLGFLQVGHKLMDTLKRRRWLGALWAIPLIFSQIYSYRSYRQTVPSSVLDEQRERCKR